MKHLLIVMVIALTVGCGPASKLIDESTYDSDLAMTSLVAALDAWQQGRVQELARRQPPIRFVDDDQKAGGRLTRYELQDKHARIRPNRGVLVKLVLQQRGKSIERMAWYQISLTPQIAVLRADP